jgi:hypothetical protein
LRINLAQFFWFGIVWGVLCWIITIPYFGLWALIAAPLLWLAGNGVRTLIFPVNRNF